MSKNNFSDKKMYEIHHVIYSKQSYPNGTHIDGEGANSWLSHHVCPPQYPNIKGILRVKGLSHYSKTGLLLLMGKEALKYLENKGKLL